MCGAPWTQDKWIKATNNEIAGYEGEYKLLDTRYNEAGQHAITIQETFGDKDVRNIYSEDGYDGEWLFGRNRKANAAKNLAARGFTYKTKPEPVVESTQVAGLQVETLVLDEAVEVEATQANATVALVDTDPTTVISHDQVTEDMVVQGRTIAQWKEESERNEHRDPKDHVHPEIAVGNEPTILEQAAFLASTTLDESIALMLMLVGGAPADLVPSLF